jgi:uncharacterized protein (TIGR03382 family)
MLRSFIVALLLAAPAFAFELRTDSEGDVVRWKRTVEFVVDANLGRQLDVPGAVATVKRAVAAFDARASVGVSVRQGAPEAGFELDAENDNAIVVVEDWPFEARNLAATVVTLNVKTNEIVDADIIINGEEAFGELGGERPGEARYDLQAMLMHELGHALGLQHNARDLDSVMYPSARPGDTARRDLGIDDVAALGTLYPPAGPISAPTVTSGPPQFGCASAPSSSLASMALLALLASLRRRRRAVRVVAPVLVAVAVAGTASAQAPAPQPPPPAIDEISWGEVVQTSSRWLPDARLIVTDAQIEVKRCVKGACTERRVRVQVLGGRVGDVEQVVSHPRKLERGMQVVLTRRAGRLEVVPAGK